MNERYLRDGLITAAGHYDHPRIGRVAVRPGRTTACFRARWRGNMLTVSCPYGVTTAAFEDFIASCEAKFLEVRPELFFPLNKVIDTPETDIAILAGTDVQPYDIMTSVEMNAPARGKIENHRVLVAPRVLHMITSPECQKAINNAVLDLAGRSARMFVLPMARRIAAEIGRQPMAWEVKKSVHLLGKCTSQGIITLNPKLAFMPADLRRFVVCHELAHLSEMNHSAAFHRLCDSYLGGREAELNRAVKAFRFPVF